MATGGGFGAGGPRSFGGPRSSGDGQLSLSGRRSPLLLHRDELASTYNMFFQESTVMAEYAQLLHHPVPGVYVLPSDVSPLIWYGLLCVRDGIYQGAIFKFTLLIPANYPNGGCPEFDFQAGVYHPLVDYETGELETKNEFQRWRRDINHIHQLLSYALKIFHTIDTTQAVNHNAATLYRTDVDKFKVKVKESIDECRQATLDPDPSDPHSIRVGEWTAEVMRSARTHIFEPEFLQDDGAAMGRNAQTCGLSWVKPGTHEPFSKEDSSSHDHNVT